MKEKSCWAVVAAVSAKRGLINFHCRPRSFDKEGFIDFLSDLRDISGDKPVTMLLDNCSIHKAKATRAAASRLGIKMIWNVPYKPAYNGIEYVWKHVK